MNIRSPIGCLLLLLAGAAGAEDGSPDPQMPGIRVEVEDVVASKTGIAMYSSNGRPAPVLRDTRVRIGLRFTPEQGILRAVPRYTLKLDAFVDNTGRDLAVGVPSATDRAFADGPAHPVFHSNGDSLFLSLATTRPPAMNAERILVKGSFMAWLGLGSILSVSNELSNLQEPLDVGPFRIIRRSLGPSFPPGASNLLIHVEGRLPERIAGIQVLDSTGRDLVVPGGLPKLLGEGTTETPLRALAIPVISSAAKPSRIVFAYYPELQEVWIPFEAQVDMGTGRARIASPTGASSEQTGPPAWSVPPPSLRPLERRPATFTSPAVPPEKPDSVAGGSVVCTSCQVVPAIKPGDRGPGVITNAYTMVRLRVEHPDAFLVRRRSPSVEITRFEDDRSTALGNAVLPTVLVDGRLMNELSDGPIGGGHPVKEMIVHVPMAAVPGAGVKTCRLTGHVNVDVCREVRSYRSEARVIKRGEPLVAGPFHFTALGPPVPSTSSPPGLRISRVPGTLKGPGGEFVQFGLQDGKDKVMGVSSRYKMPAVHDKGPPMKVDLSVFGTPEEPYRFFTHVGTTIETLRIPFDLTIPVQP